MGRKRRLSSLRFKQYSSSDLLSSSFLHIVRSIPFQPSVSLIFIMAPPAPRVQAQPSPRNQGTSRPAAAVPSPNHAPSDAHGREIGFLRDQLDGAWGPHAWGPPPYYLPSSSASTTPISVCNRLSNSEISNLYQITNIATSYGVRLESLYKKGGTLYQAAVRGFSTPHWGPGTSALALKMMRERYNDEDNESANPSHDGGSQNMVGSSTSTLSQKGFQSSSRKTSTRMVNRSSHGTGSTPSSPKDYAATSPSSVQSPTSNSRHSLSDIERKAIEQLQGNKALTHDVIDHLHGKCPTGIPEHVEILDPLQFGPGSSLPRTLLMPTKKRHIYFLVHHTNREHWSLIHMEPKQNDPTLSISHYDPSGNNASPSDLLKRRILSCFVTSLDVEWHNMVSPNRDRCG